MRRCVPLFRVSCVLLVLFGLSLSLVEGAQCRDADNTLIVQVIGSAGSDAGGTEIPSEAPAPGRGHCCPCIHAYPNLIMAAASPAPTVVGYSTPYPPQLHAPRDRHPQPLVPPPIA